METNSFGTTPITTTSITIVVDCAVASIANLDLTTTPFSATKQITYTLYSGTFSVDFSKSVFNPLTQTPVCGYAWSAKTYTFSTLPSWITKSNSPASGDTNSVLNILSSDPSILANSPYTFTIATTATPALPSGAAALSPSNATSGTPLSFTVAIVDPCATTTVQPVVVVAANGAETTGLSLSGTSGSPTQINNGGSLVIKFKNAIAQADADAGLTICGSKTYAFCNDNTCTSALNFAAIAADASDSTKKILTLSPNTNTNTPTAIGAFSNLYLVITLNAGTAYASKHAQGPFFIEVIAAVCNCNKARWQTPTTGNLRVNVADT